MIISASYKTDIPAFYGDWFMRRIGAGFCRMVNPYGGHVYTVPLTRDAVDGFVFWTRNSGPFMGALEAVNALGFPFVVQYTITGYPRSLDAATVRPEMAISHLREIANAYGSRAGVWRYDPIVLSSLTPAHWHRENFARLADALEGVADEVVVSVVQPYRKTARNMAAAARTGAFEWSDPTAEEKTVLLTELAAIAADHSIAATLCGQPELLAEGMAEASCIDAGRLSDVAGRPLAAKRKPHRKTCACHASRDIGDYDTCPHGCAYCYAVSDKARAKRRFAAHDPAGEFLFAPSG
ncbi:MAG: DUF1848 domain-containing protein [Rhodospirillales bacterium]|jgi:hypothetical protein|nr:DUF1848 domain-containing protein [Rhodospirillales bacterium]